MYRHILEKNHSIHWKNASFVFNNKNKEDLQMVESALISKLPIRLQVFIPFPITLRKILYLNYISNDPFFYFNINDALFVGSSFLLYIMLLELMPRWHTLSRSLFLYRSHIFFNSWPVAEVHETLSIFSEKFVCGLINIHTYVIKNKHNCIKLMSI